MIFETNGYWIIGKLADFILIIGEERLLMTTSSQADLETVFIHYQRLNPAKEYRKKKFAVRVLKKEFPDKVVSWEQIPGFSLWEVLPQNNDN